MRMSLALATVAAMAIAVPGFAQSSNRAAHRTAHNGRVLNGTAGARDDSTSAANRARRGVEPNGNANGNNMTGGNGS